MSANPNPLSPNPRRIAAGKLNRLKRGPLTPKGRDQLRHAALAHRPWAASTGPRTPEGKARASQNGKLRQKGEMSVRELRRSLLEMTSLVDDMEKARVLVAEVLASSS